MTADSQLISGKVIRAIARRGFAVLQGDRPISRSLQSLDGELFKRLFDILFPLSVLILFAPVYLLLAFSIALSSSGPIFYVQERVGKNRKRFYCLKFRTMVENADDILLEIMEKSPHLRQEFEDNFKLKQDPRITWIGRFLRMTSLDEFPQFWNVLKGDMSVVGARPLVEEELPRYWPSHQQNSYHKTWNYRLVASVRSQRHSLSPPSPNRPLLRK